MTKTLQLKRGSTAANNAYTGSVGEITVDTTTHSLRVHDGLTTGGYEVGSGGGEENVIEVIKLNGTQQTVTDKTVDLSVQTPLSSTNKVSSMFIDDTVGGAQNTHKFVTASDKTNWNNKQEAISDLGTIRTNASEALKQKSTLPTASADELGKIYQYTGTTDSYVNGYFYKCVLVEESGAPDTYIWEQLEFSAPVDNFTIQENSSDELEVIGVKSTNATPSTIKFWTGTQAEYDLIQNKDPMTMYIILPAQS